MDLAFKFLENKLKELDPATAEPEKEASVLIVAPYKPHVARINQLVELEYHNRGFKENLNFIRAGTIHSFQGSEADIVIFDLVIDEPHWKANLFMTDKEVNEDLRKMFNVAVTRAKFKLYIVGNFAYCQKRAKNNALSELLDKLIKKDRLVKVDAKTLLPEIVFARQSDFAFDGNLTGKHIVCREDVFNDYFMADIHSFKKRLIVYSAFMTEARLSTLLPAFSDAVRAGKQIIVVTKALSDRGKFELAQYQKCEKELRDIPWWIKAGTNQPNVEADILFSPCVGQEIVSVEVNTRITDKDPMFFCAFNEPPYQRELVSNVTLRLRNGLGLQISPDIDYCEVACVDVSNEWVKISFSELKDALFNWEDLHADEVTGFEAESHMLFFGRKGAAYTDTPYMTLSSSGKGDSCLHVYVEDFLILDWSISLAIGSWFDEYGEYHFSHKEWNDLLDEAWRILAADSFDELFDELIDRQGKGNYMMWKLNSRGASFWKERDKYRTQIKDIREWSDLVLGPNDMMDIYGF